MKYKFEGPLILGEDENFKPYMGISRAISEGYELNIQEIVALYQDRLRKVLESYLNVYYPLWYLENNNIIGFSRDILSLTFLKKRLFAEPGRLFFSPLYLPLKLIVKRFDLPHNKKAEKLLVKLQKNDKKSSLFNIKVSELLSDCYQLLQSIFDLNKMSECENKVSAVKSFDEQIYEKHGLQIVTKMKSDLNDRFTDYLVGTYLHGSLSTLDYTPFSDMDVLHVINKESLQSGEKIRELSYLNLELSLLLYSHDWLQHHRFQIVSEYDLDWYNPSYLPPEVLDHATALCGKEQIRIFIRSPMFSAYEHLWGCIQNLRRKINENFIYIDNLWKLKDLVSLVSFFPVLYLGIKEEFCYKKHSFDKARIDFNNREWEAVEIATYLRSAWHPIEANKSQIKMREKVLLKLKNPVLFQDLMATSREPIPDYLLEELKKTHFFKSIPVFVEAVANRMRGI